MEAANSYAVHEYRSEHGRIVDNSYKKIAHANEVERQNDGAGNVPTKVINSVRARYKRKKIPFEKVNRADTCFFLRQLGYQKYYENYSHINLQISKKPISQPKDGFMKCVVKGMWKSCAALWGNCPAEIKKGRTSFPNYRDFFKRCWLTLGEYEVAADMKHCTTPLVTEELNEIWKWFAKMHAFSGVWEHWERGIFKVERKKYAIKKSTSSSCSRRRRRRIAKNKNRKVEDV